MSVARIIPDSVRSRQVEASDPAAAVFVAANAGSEASTWRLRTESGIMRATLIPRPPRRRPQATTP